MTAILTDTGKHAWIEIYSGGKQHSVEAYYCIRCGERSRQPWNDPGPMLRGCAAGDQPYDRSALHRQPARPEMPAPPVMAPSVGASLRFPYYLLAVGEAGALSPVLAEFGGPFGFVLVRDAEETQRVVKILEGRGLKLGPTQEIVVTHPVHDLDAFEALVGLADRCEQRPACVYWDLRRDAEGHIVGGRWPIPRKGR